VRPVGWHNWNLPDREKTARYAEFNSTGPGANPTTRVKWARQLTKAEAKQITLKKVLGGVDGWNPKTGRLAALPLHSAVRLCLTGRLF
jgi:pectinesterase